MKTLIKLVAACLLAAVVILLVRYHSVDPCRILEREMVTRVERGTRAARDSVREAAGRLAGEDAQHATDRVAAAVENVTVGVAAGLAKSRVENMSRSECVAEMWRLTMHDGDRP
jgi:hypothetical protein